MFRGDAGTDVLYPRAAPPGLVMRQAGATIRLLLRPSAARLDFPGGGLRCISPNNRKCHGSSEVEFDGNAILFFEAAALTEAELLF